MSEITILQRSLSKAATSVEEHPNTQNETGDDVALPEERALNLDRLRVEIETLRTKTTILRLEHHMRRIALLLLFIFMSVSPLSRFLGKGR